LRPYELKVPRYVTDDHDAEIRTADHPSVVELRRRSGITDDAVLQATVSDGALLITPA
jgi:hypothetical protein